MNHLSDKQLTLVLYQEQDSEADSWDSHLKQCEQCRARLGQMTDVLKELDSLVVVPREFQVDVPSIVDSPATAERTGVVETSSKRPSFGFAVLAASVMMFIGGASFMAGSVYQSAQTVDLVRAEIARTISLETQAPVSAPNAPLDSRMIAEIQEHFSQFDQSLASQYGKISNENRLAWENIQMRFGQILNEQLALRRDLKTLAINAESEITSAQRDIRRIDEFVSILRPPN